MTDTPNEPSEKPGPAKKPKSHTEMIANILDHGPNTGITSNPNHVKKLVDEQISQIQAEQKSGPGGR